MKNYFLGSVGLIALLSIVWIGASVSAQTGFFSGLFGPKASTTLVLSQVAPGGGGSTGTYVFDYIEIKNISGSSQSLNGLSLYYGSATGKFASSATNAFALPNVSLNPGQYYLVQLGSAGTAGAAFPVTPDATSSGLSMSGTSGKVALVNTAGFPQNTCGDAAAICSAAQLAQIVDWVAYGAAGNGTAGNGEGGTAVNNGSAIAAPQGAVRKAAGCTDTDNNNSDFNVITAPVPRNTSTAVNLCAGGPTPTLTPEKPNPAKQFDELLLASNIVKAKFGAAPKAEPDLQKVCQDISPDYTPVADHKPYDLSAPDGITRHVAPGTRIASGKYPVVTGLEHDELGHPTGSPKLHMQMTAKRRNKLRKLAWELPVPKTYGPDEGHILLVGWGSAEGPLREAVDRARSVGEPISALNLKHINPLPNGLERIFKGFHHVFVVELNDEGIYGHGQFAQLLRARYADPKIHGITKTDGLTWKVKEILDRARALAHSIRSNGE